MSSVPPDIVSLADYERHARKIIADPVWAYIAGAGADGLTRRWNREAFDRLMLQGSVLADMRGATARTSLFGMEMASPIILAPVAFQKLVHPDGELATALGAGAMQTWMTLSTQSSVAMEEVAASAHAPLLFQLYFQARREDTLRLVQRAEAAGFKALVVTVDAPVSGVRNEERRARFRLPEGIEAVHLRGVADPVSTANAGESPVFKGMLDKAPTWDDLAWLRAETRLPLLVKGILNPADALRAADLGADAVVVSNHGGRTLDTLPPTIDALPSIAERLAGRVPIVMDGGIRRGTDVLKALALGADAVMIGQPLLHGLAVAGAVGVAHVVGILRAELEVAMALTGRATIQGIDRSVIWTKA